MKDYQVTAIIALIVSAGASMFFVGGYYAQTYSFAGTALLGAIAFSFVALWLGAEAIMDYRAARRLERWSAGK